MRFSCLVKNSNKGSAAQAYSGEQGMPFLIFLYEVKFWLLFWRGANKNLVWNRGLVQTKLLPLS